MKKTLIKGGLIINEGKSSEQDILMSEGRMERIDRDISHKNVEIIEAKGLWVIPGIIDDQVHFRDPGMPSKADIHSESRAAVAGGVTSFMDMPNTKPATLTQALLEEKYLLGKQKSLINYSFFMGVSNDNVEEVLRTDPETVCGIKIFMGSSTGNMLVDDRETLNRLFKETPMLIATHCEDEGTIRKNMTHFQRLYGDQIPFDMHPLIRDEEACYLSSSLAVALAKEHNTRLHVLHISTEEELELFDNEYPLAQKRITGEVCVHHLYFDRSDYALLGSKIKCNPAIKEARHKAALLRALLDDTLDIIATDHAPHTIKEKAGSYLSAPSGLPLVQHSLQLMLDFVHRGKITKERMVEKMSHAPADCFRIKDRGYLREGYYADIVIVEPHTVQVIDKDNILYKCGWSPLEGQSFEGKVKQTFVNGTLIYDKGKIKDLRAGQRLLFNV